MIQHDNPKGYKDAFSELQHNSAGRRLEYNQVLTLVFNKQLKDFFFFIFEVLK